MEKLIEEGRSLELYLESEQADKGSDDLDAMWQSIYDVYHLVCIGIIEGDKEDEAMIEAKEWLEKAKADTSMYQGMVL
ncbi:hypothetical protein [Tannockella kyphosi]|uniref:hypothetical protein n=1 Tax=Tannockella kyphosi TaxID=2899121 RepID=UPI002012020E|nr:hypothetical protein [Tannockella kyphosi]